MKTEIKLQDHTTFNPKFAMSFKSFTLMLFNFFIYGFWRF